MGRGIVFAGTRDTWERWRDLFESNGIELHLAEVIEPVPSMDLEERISSINPTAVAAAVFTSKSSAKILLSLKRGEELVGKLSDLGALITATGDGTASTLSSRGYRVFSPPIERVGAIIEILGKVVRRGEIVIFSSDRLEIPGGALPSNVRRIEVYKLKIKAEGIAELESMLRRGFDEIIVASRTASEALCIAKHKLGNRVVEVHAMTERMAEPLLQCIEGGFKLVIHGSSTFREFMTAVIKNTLSST